jgi:hypothetical protein
MQCRVSVCLHVDAKIITFYLHLTLDVNLNIRVCPSRHLIFTGAEVQPHGAVVTPYSQHKLTMCTRLNLSNLALSYWRSSGILIQWSAIFEDDSAWLWFQNPSWFVLRFEFGLGKVTLTIGFDTSLHAYVPCNVLYNGVSVDSLMEIIQFAKIHGL